MTNELKINNGRLECIIGEKGIKHFEKQYPSTYVADLCLKDKYGNWANEPAAIFYQETPPQPGFSNYFAVVVREQQTFITSGESAVSEPIIGIQADDGEVIFSRYRHDFRNSTDKSVFIWLFNISGLIYLKLIVSLLLLKNSVINNTLSK